MKKYEEELTNRKIEINGISYGVFMIYLDGETVASGDWKVIRIKLE